MRISFSDLKRKVQSLLQPIDATLACMPHLPSLVCRCSWGWVTMMRGRQWGPGFYHPLCCLTWKPSRYALKSCAAFLLVKYICLQSTFYSIFQYSVFSVFFIKFQCVIYILSMDSSRQDLKTKGKHFSNSVFISFFELTTISSINSGVVFIHAWRGSICADQHSFFMHPRPLWSHIGIDG